MGFTSETAAEAGAKSKRGEAKLTKLIREIVDTDSAVSVFNKLEEMALSGNMDAIKVYLSYAVGKPKEFLDITSAGKSISAIKIVDVDGTDL